MPIKLIAFDLDDTLMRDDLTVSEADRLAIAQARARGIIIAPASGRMLKAMRSTLDTINQQGPVLTLNGGRTVDYPSLKPLYERFIPLPICIEVARLARELGAYLQTYTGEDFEFDSPCEYSALYGRLAGSPGAAVGDLEKFLLAQGIPSQKLLFIETDKQRMAALRARVVERVGDSLSVFHSKPTYLELTHSEASKGLALAALAERYGIRREEIMAIGDGENDIPMLTYAGIGVAVANAGEKVKASADYVTLSNMESGVGAAIHKFVLEGGGA